MQFEKHRLSAETRRQLEALESADGDLSSALNRILEGAISEGALSEVGRKKAKVLQLVPLKRASERGSSG